MSTYAIQFKYKDRDILEQANYIRNFNSFTKKKNRNARDFIVGLEAVYSTETVKRVYDYFAKQRTQGSGDEQQVGIRLGHYVKINGDIGAKCQEFVFRYVQAASTGHFSEGTSSDEDSGRS